MQLNQPGMNRTWAGTSRCDVPACAVAGGTIPPLDAAGMAQRAVPTTFLSERESAGVRLVPVNNSGLARLARSEGNGRVGRAPAGPHRIGAHLTVMQLTGLPSQSEAVKVAVGFIPRMDITNDTVA
jgi:hypothetical protein